MGIYLNPRNMGFRMAVQSEIYVDKTGLIAYTKIHGLEYARRVLQPRL